MISSMHPHFGAQGIMWCRKLWAGFTKFLAKEAEAGGGLKQS